MQARLTADIELKQMQSGVSFTEFTVAWSEKYKEVETKCFLRCKTWRQTAEFLSKYFKKGSELIVEGKMVTEQWEKDGQAQSRTICDVEKVHFCGSKSDNGSKPDSNGYPAPNFQQGENANFEEIEDTDGLPF